MAEIISTNVPATESQIVEFEAVIGARLPDQYRDFLMKYNGGKTSPNYFRFHDGPYGDGEVKTLWALGGHPSGLETEQEGLKTEGMLPDGIVCIGIDTGDSGIGILIFGQNYGAVAYLDFFGGGDQTNVYIFANSFSDFLDKLVDPPEYVTNEMDDLIAANDLEGIERLLDGGWNIDEENVLGYTHLDRATMQRKKDLMAFFLDRGASIGKSLEIAIKSKNIELINLIKLYGDK